jgi:hypothetical protein
VVDRLLMSSPKSADADSAGSNTTIE